MMLTLAVALAVVAGDQVSKRLASVCLTEGRAWSLPGIGIRLLHVVNARRGWHSRQAFRVRALAWPPIVAVGLLMSAMTGTAAAHAGIGAIIGGTAGNLIEASRGRGITDFIDLRVWPVFNLADAAIVLGACLTAWAVIPRLQ